MDRDDEVAVEEALLQTDSDRSSSEDEAPVPTRRPHHRRSAKPAVLQDPALKPALTYLQVSPSL